MKPQQLYLLDGNNLFWRVFHAPFQDLSCRCPHCRKGNLARSSILPCPVCNGSGIEPTKATWQFTTQLFSFYRTYNPSHLAVCFDGERSALRRRKIFPGYKANRLEPDPKAFVQIWRIQQILSALGVRYIKCSGYEADDALASLAVQGIDRGMEVHIVSRDKDMAQLCVHENIFILDPIERTWRNRKNAGTKWGVQTEQLIDFFTLAGDGTDNIKGVPGIGEKIAAGLLNRYGSLGSIVHAAKFGQLKPATGNSILKALQSGWLRKMQDLVTLDVNIDLTVTIDDLKVGILNMAKARPIFKALEFRNL